jgi:hypothetical protein
MQSPRQNSKNWCAEGQPRTTAPAHGPCSHRAGQITAIDRSQKMTETERMRDDGR